MELREAGPLMSKPHSCFVSVQPQMLQASGDICPSRLWPVAQDTEALLAQPPSYPLLPPVAQQELALLGRHTDVGRETCKYVHMQRHTGHTWHMVHTQQLHM